MSHEFLSDLFDDQLQSVGKALVAIGAVAYFAGQAERSTIFHRDKVQYAIEAHLPQGYDRSIIAARANQHLTKTLILRTLRLQELKEQNRLAVDREAKINGMSELFVLTLAGILSAAHVHSLNLTLHAIKNMILVLVYILRKREEEQGTSGKTIISKIRSWWSGGTQNLIMQTILEKMQENMEISPFAQLFNNEDDNMTDSDVERCFSVQALLQIAIPHVVKTSLQVVREALSRRPPDVFNVVGSVSGSDLRELLAEICTEFESHVVWSDWLTFPSPQEDQQEKENNNNNNTDNNTDNNNNQRGNNNSNNNNNNNNNNSSTSSSNGNSATRVSPNSGESQTNNNNNNNNNKEEEDEEDEVFIFPAGSSALSNALEGGSRRERERLAVERVFGPPRDLGPAEQAARAEAQRREAHARDQATQFFTQMCHSPSFSEICIAYAGEVLERVTHEAGDLRELRGYCKEKDCAKTLLVISSLEKYRLQLFDGDFEVQPYLRLLCEETVRATCNGM